MCFCVLFKSFCLMLTFKLKTMQNHQLLQKKHLIKITTIYTKDGILYNMKKKNKLNIYFLSVSSFLLFSIFIKANNLSLSFSQSPQLPHYYFHFNVVVYVFFFPNDICWTIQFTGEFDNNLSCGCRIEWTVKNDFDKAN